MEYSIKQKMGFDSFSIKNYLPEIGIEKVRKELIDGLTQSPKLISSKYFYDGKGSQLFEGITKLEEYYPTRTEKSILINILSKLNLDFTNLSVIELGSGDPSKISLIFDQINEADLYKIYYYPVDISRSAIENSAAYLYEKYNGIFTSGIVVDFINQTDILPNVNNKLICFFGSTIGNLKQNEIQIFLQKLSSVMERGDNFLLGIDMIKNIEILENAYNDHKGLTAAFNKNILNVVNKLIGSNFDSAKFEHYAFYNNEERRIEMHLKAKEKMRIEVDSNDTDILINQGEMIHTENSHKFRLEDIEQFAHWGCLNIENIFTDENKWFSVVHFRK